MKSILLSIKPEYVAKILNGEKTIEIRKHAIPVGTKVYIYCTKGKPIISTHITVYDTIKLNRQETMICKCNRDVIANGKVVASFVVERCEKYERSKYVKNVYCNEYHSFDNLSKWSCVDYQSILDYGKEKPLFAWHISQLKIFDRPKEIKEFFRLCNHSCNYKCKYFNGAYCQSDLLQITKAPQSYCYVEELK